MNHSSVDLEGSRQLSPLERFAAPIIEEEFEKLSKDCEYRSQAGEGTPVCRHPHSSGQECGLDSCPRLSEVAK